MSQRPSTRQSLAINLSYLLKTRGLSERDLALKSGVSQKTINNIVNARTSANTENVDKLARVFGLDGWHLILPDLIKDIESGGTITKMVSNYLASSKSGQEMIFQIAEREAKYGNQR